MFEYRFIRFNWDYTELKFVPTKFNCHLPYSTLREKLSSTQMLGLKQRRLHRLIYGSARIEVPRESATTLLINEVLNPFFLFESLCILLWFYDGAAWFAASILVYNTIAVAISLFETLSSNAEFRRM
jgi:hypothetical protein